VQAPVAIDKGRELPLQTFARPRLSIEWAIRPFAHNLPEFAARQTAVASGWAARVVIAQARSVRRTWPNWLPTLFPASLSLTIPRQGASCAARNGKIAEQIDPTAEMDLPDKPPGMHWSRYNQRAERFEHQNLCTIATMRRFGVVLPRFRGRR
jgi:hypothetical protein